MEADDDDNLDLTEEKEPEVEKKPSEQEVYLKLCCLYKLFHTGSCIVEEKERITFYPLPHKPEFELP